MACCTAVNTREEFRRCQQIVARYRVRNPSEMVCKAALAQTYERGKRSELPMVGYSLAIDVVHVNMSILP